MNKFVLKKRFHKNKHISFFNKYFYKNKQSKLCFGDRVAVLNVIYFLYGGSILTWLFYQEIEGKHDDPTANST